ncbi:MAG: MFS transporter [Kofleriaceae bacterium]
MVSGLASVAEPDIERSFGASHAFETALLFLVPGIVALVVEPILFVLADRYPRRWFIRGGLIAMAGACLLGAYAQHPYVLAAAQAVKWCAIGAASGLAQATLVDAAGDARARTIARWTLLSLGGDLGAPALLALVALAGYGWRTAYLVMSMLLGAWALAMLFVPIDGTGEGDDDADEPGPGVIAALRLALRDRRLLLWLFATALCDLLDEIFIVLASIHVRDDLGASARWQTATIIAFALGDVIGLVALDRILKKVTELRVLAAAAAGCAVAYTGWLLAPTPLWGVILIVPVGMCVGPLYPLASAQAYAARPESSGLVLAASHLFTPMGLAIPFALGAIADVAGTPVALALLVIQPVGLCILAIWQLKRR